MNFDFINIIFNKLFDKTQSLTKRFFLFIAILALIFLLDNHFSFSDNYVLTNKINNLRTIEVLKKEIIPNYQPTSEIKNNINDLENSIFNTTTWYSRLFQYLKGISNGNIKIDFVMFLSIQWFWILFFGVIFFQTFISKKGINGLGEIVALTLFTILIMVLWASVFPFITYFIGITSRGLTIATNIILNLIMLILLVKFGPNKK